jgi:hypothetical protein
MGHGPYLSFEARKSALLRMTEESAPAVSRHPMQGTELVAVRIAQVSDVEFDP